VIEMDRTSSKPPPLLQGNGALIPPWSGKKKNREQRKERKGEKGKRGEGGEKEEEEDKRKGNRTKEKKKE